MIIEKLELMLDQVLVYVEGRGNHILAFDLHTIPNTERLVQLIKDKIAEIDEPPGTPPETDWEPFFATLKNALEGTDIGD